MGSWQLLSNDMMVNLEKNRLITSDAAKTNDVICSEELSSLILSDKTKMKKDSLSFLPFSFQIKRQICKFKDDDCDDEDEDDSIHSLLRTKQRLCSNGDEEDRDVTRSKREEKKWTEVRDREKRFRRVLVIIIIILVFISSISTQLKLLKNACTSIETQTSDRSS